MAYIPPHKLRSLHMLNSSSSAGVDRDGQAFTRGGRDEKQVSTANQNCYSHNDHVSLHEIHKHYWPEQLVAQKNLTPNHSTLNGSADHPNTLRYIILFHDSNPRWEKEKIIFVKTKLNLLGFPENESARKRSDTEQPSPSLEHYKSQTFATSSNTSTKEHSSSTEQEHSKSAEKWDAVAAADSDTPTTETEATSTAPITRLKLPFEPVAIFEQLRRGRSHDRVFRFTGHFAIEKLEYLRPWSPELVRMMRQKWEQPTGNRGRNRRDIRESSQWESSMRVPWSVVKLSEISPERVAELALKPPQIEHINKEEPANRQSVNDFLRQLRMSSDHNEEPRNN